MLPWADSSSFYRASLFRLNSLSTAWPPSVPEVSNPCKTISPFRELDFARAARREAGWVTPSSLPGHDPWPHWRSSAAGASLKSRQSCCRVQCLDVRFARPVRMSPYGELYSRCRTFVRGASAGHRRGCSSAANRSNPPNDFRLASCRARFPSAVLHSARRTWSHLPGLAVSLLYISTRLCSWSAYS